MKKIVRIGKAVAPVLLVLAVAITLVWNLLPAKAAPVDTYHGTWNLVETVATEDAATFAAALALATSEGDFANKTSEAFQIRAFHVASGGTYSPGGAWMFAFCGTDAANETFSFNLVGWARENGMAQIICEGDGVLGTQDVVIYPGGSTATSAFWADTINLDETTKWPSVAVYNSADDEVALLVVDLTGLEWIDFITYDVAGGSEATSLGVYGRRY